MEKRDDRREKLLRIVLEDIVWFLFGDGSNEHIENQYGFEHSLTFVRFEGNDAFIVRDIFGGEYSLKISERELLGYK